MPQRVSLKDPASAIQHIERDGGVILTDFSTSEDLAKVNADAAPYITAMTRVIAPLSLSFFPKSTHDIIPCDSLLCNHLIPFHSTPFTYIFTHETCTHMYSLRYSLVSTPSGLGAPVFLAVPARSAKSGSSNQIS